MLKALNQKPFKQLPNLGSSTNEEYFNNKLDLFESIRNDSSRHNLDEFITDTIANGSE